MSYKRLEPGEHGDWYGVWETIDFKPLPGGWFNHYVDSDEGSGQEGRIHRTSCPGIVVRQHREDHQQFRKSDGAHMVRYRTVDEPYEKRYRYAEGDYGEVGAVTEGDSYLGTYYEPCEVDTWRQVGGDERCAQTGPYVSATEAS